MMKKINKQILFRLAKISVLALLALLIVISGYVYVTINGLKLKLKQARIVNSQIEFSHSTLETDTAVQKSTIKDFLIFTTQGESSDFLKKLTGMNKVEINRNTMFLNTEVELPEIEINSCHRYKCIQIRKKFSQIPSSVWKGLLGTEDFRFLEHRGVDPIAVARAIVVDVLAMKFVQGGSTLTQQLVKNLFLTSERKISRKIKEMIYAIYIENILGKEEIITLYLNEVFWGTFQGIYLKGYYAASLAYFGKAPRYLSEFETTILVSLLKGPGYYKPTRKIHRLKDRVTSVYRRLQGLNLVSHGANNIWNEEQWVNFSENFISRNKKYSFYNYYLVSKNRENNMEPYEKYVFYKSINQNKLRLKKITKDADIAIKVLVADKSCESFECNKIFSFYSKQQRDKRKSMTTELHQIGSLFKPIVYDTFIELGRSYDEKVSRGPITLKLKSGNWSPKDYSKAKHKYITIKKALQKSKNIPLIRVANEVGFDNLEKKLIKIIPRLKTPLAEYPAQLLGAIELSMEEVFQIYNKFIKKKCELIKSNSLKLEDTILYYMSVASETTISRIAKAPLKDAYIFGKTGTTNNGLDNWYFAYDGREVYVLWFGVDSGRSKHNFRISGATTSFAIFQDFINNRGKQISEILCD